MKDKEELDRIILEEELDIDQIVRSESIVIRDLEATIGKELRDKTGQIIGRYFKFENKHVTDLNLIQSNLSQIPKHVTAFKHLKSLDLRKNNIKELPVFLLDLKCLERLFLEENPIIEIPKILLENIQSVNVTDSYDRRIAITFKNKHKSHFEAYFSSNLELDRSLVNYYKDNFSDDYELFIVSGKLSKIFPREEFLEYVNNLNVAELKSFGYFSSTEEKSLFVYLDGMLEQLESSGTHDDFIYSIINALGPYITQYLIDHLIDQDNYLRNSVLDALTHIDGVNKLELKEILFSTPHQLKMEYIFSLLQILTPEEFFDYIDKFHAQKLKSANSCQTSKARTIIAEIIMKECIDREIIEKLAEHMVDPIIEITHLHHSDFLHDFTPEDVVNLLKDICKIISPPESVRSKISNCISHIYSVEKGWGVGS